jgi:hypothetical protein
MPVQLENRRFSGRFHIDPWVALRSSFLRPEATLLMISVEGIRYLLHSINVVIASAFVTYGSAIVNTVVDDLRVYYAKQLHCFAGSMHLDELLVTLGN